MITTLFLLLLLGFKLWYLTSEKTGVKEHPAFLQPLLKDKRKTRIVSGIIIILALILFVVKLGPMSGLAAGVMGLMGVGCAVVLLCPYKYLSVPAVVVLYLLFLTLEFVI